MFGQLFQDLRARLNLIERDAGSVGFEDKPPTSPADHASA